MSKEEQYIVEDLIPTQPVCKSCGHSVATTYFLLKRQYFKDRNYVKCHCGEVACTYYSMDRFVEYRLKEEIA
jgi:hypothetical protein